MTVVVSDPFHRRYCCSFQECVILAICFFASVALGFVPSTNVPVNRHHVTTRTNMVRYPEAAAIVEETTTATTSTRRYKSNSKSNNNNKSNGPREGGIQSKEPSQRNVSKESQKKNGKGRPQNSSSSSSSINNTIPGGTQTNPTTTTTTEEPWKAGYHTSLKTQGRIQRAATATRGPALVRAVAVVNAFLASDATKCNAANLVCALTTSAKVAAAAATPSSSTSRDDNDQSSMFHAPLHALLKILRIMLEDNLLSTRQLCNAAWALAKHVERDQALKPTSPRRLSSRTTAAAAANNSTLAQEMHIVVDRMAVALTDKLRQAPASAKNGELCMACWAYGRLRERQRPPGWKTRPRMGLSTAVPDGESPSTSWLAYTHDVSSSWRRIRRQRQQTVPSSRNSRTIHSRTNRFREEEDEEGDDDDDDSQDSEEQEPEKASDAVPWVNAVVPQSVTDILFEEIALVLCQPTGAAEKAATIAAAAAAAAAENDGTAVVWRMDTCPWKEWANVAWAFVTHGWCNSIAAQQLLERIATQSTRRMNAAAATSAPPTSRDLAQLVWSLGIAQSDNFQLADSLVALVQAVKHQQQSSLLLAHWNCADLVQVALSLAHARLDERELLQALYQESRNRLPEEPSEHEDDHRRPLRTRRGRSRDFYFWEVCILLWAQARLHLTETQHPSYPSFATRAIESMESAAREAGSLGAIGIGSQEKANLAWSVVILEQYQHTEAAVRLLERIFDESARELQRQGGQVMPLEHAHQMWQALFLCRAGDCPQAVERVPDWFYDYLRSCWQHEKARPKLSSARHKAISQALIQMGVAHHNEHVEDIDVAIVLEPHALWTHQTSLYQQEINRGGNARQTSLARKDNASQQQQQQQQQPVRVAVEFDGPNHFTRPALATSQEPPRSLGHSLLKYRLLNKQGWNVIRVPYYEFDKIPFWASMERQRYLQRLLKTHATIRFSKVDVSEYKPLALSHQRQSRFD